MDRSAITTDVVHDALRAVRYGKPLDESPLLRLSALRARLQAAGHDDTPESRSAELSVYLADVVADRLGALRGTPTGQRHGQPTPEQELKALDDDFAAGRVDREAWSTLYARFLANAPLQVRQISARTEVAQRTLTRRTERGYALLAEELKRRELVEAPAAQHNIPYSLTRFIGRESEIGQVRRLLAQHRLVTLTGVGGIGKSRLAMRLGRAVARDYADGAWMVELGAVEDDEHVVLAAAAALEVREQQSRRLLDTLSDHVEPKHLLLVLDNCEHLTEACGDLVQALLGRALDMQVLATSRERLRLQGECVWTVPPLGVPDLAADASPRPSTLVHVDSVRLFTDRAATALPGFALTPANARHVAEVCRGLDGIPLATELAASRVTVLSPRELANRLATPLEVLKDGRRPTRPQHETLRSTLDWSHDLLSDAEQVLFRRLSVFRGGWTLDAAEAVCTDDGIEKAEVLDLLQGLVDKSMVVVLGTSGERRYRMLQTVRQYAAEQLAERGESTAIRDRQLAYFESWADEELSAHRHTDDARWLASFEAEHANMQAGLEHACHAGESVTGLRLAATMHPFWSHRGYWALGDDLLTRLLAATHDEDESIERAAVLGRRGDLRNQMGIDVEGRDDCEEALAICRELKDDEGIAAHLRTLGTMAYGRCDYDLARSLFEESLSTQRRLGDDDAGILNQLGTVSALQGDHLSAQEYYEEALALWREQGDELRTAMARCNLANATRALGVYDAAKRHGDAALETFGRLDHKLFTANAHQVLGDIARDMGDEDLARKDYLQSLSIRRDLGQPGGLYFALIGFACLADLSDSLRPSRLHGFVETWLGAMPPLYQTMLDAAAARSVATHGQAAHDAAYTEGSGLTLEEAAAYAASEVTWEELDPVAKERLAKAE